MTSAAARKLPPFPNATPSQLIAALPRDPMRRVQILLHFAVHEYERGISVLERRIARLDRVGGLVRGIAASPRHYEAAGDDAFAAYDRMEDIWQLVQLGISALERIKEAAAFERYCQRRRGELEYEEPGLFDLLPGEAGVVQ